MNAEQAAKLREPFPEKAIGRKPRGGVQLDFVGHANITDRLLTVDPNWTWEPFALDEKGSPLVLTDARGQAALWIRLTVCDVTRIGVGTCEKNAPDPLKELVGDALRNAAMRFGVALDLWAREDLESSVPAGSSAGADPAIPSDPGERHTRPQSARARKVAEATQGVKVASKHSATEHQKEAIRGYCADLSIDVATVLPLVDWKPGGELSFEAAARLTPHLEDAASRGLTGDDALQAIKASVSLGAGRGDS